MKPLKLKPVCKDYIWGGNRLVKEYNKKCDLERVAESWELSTHKDGESIVADGTYQELIKIETDKEKEDKHKEEQKNGQDIS